MRAIAMTDYESGVALHELPRPEPAPNELLVRVHASSVNRIDVLIVGGMLKGMMEYEFLAVPGRDFAGTVEQVGSDAGRFEVGDEVFGFLTKPAVHEGAWAEYLTVPEDGFVANKPSATNVMASADTSVMARLAELAAGGELKPAIDAVLTFAETPAAIERFTAGKRGKIVISLADGR